MTKAEQLAWAAGLYDGEGWASSARYNRITGGMTATITMGVGQADREVLDRFRAAVDLGNVTGPSRGMFAWRVHGLEKVEAVALLLWPYLGTIKRAQLRRVLSDAREYRRRQPKRLFTAEQLRAIRSRLATGERQADIARDLGCGKSSINAIARGRSYREAVH